MDQNVLKSPIEYFFQWEEQIPDKPFLKQPQGSKWKIITYKEAGQQARRIAKALHESGLQSGDHIGIISKNCYHWILADLAIMIGGFISVPFYASLSATQLEEVIEKSDCKAIFVGKLDKWDDNKSKVVENMPVIRFPQYKGNSQITIGQDWDEVLEKHEGIQENISPNLDELWTIIFTSGTTGSPKGVMHTQRNAALLIHSEEKHNFIKTFDRPVGGNRYFSFLPLNHIAERSAIELGALMNGGNISFADSLESFAQNLKDTKPTMFFAVPRIWTKFHLGVLANTPQKKLDKLLKIPIISGMVKKKIINALGLSDTDVMLTGASITPEPLKQWYRSLGMNLREVYGMTENFGAFTMMPDKEHRPDTVGKPIPEGKGKIDELTGEILMQLPYIMKGYYKDPELSAETLADGWLHTGDQGEVDEDGFFKVIGRVKDTFKTAKGKFVTPTIIEEEFGGQEIIEQICVSGLGLTQPVALICLSEIGLKKPKSEVEAELANQLEEINTRLEAHERLSAIVIADEAWSDDNGMLTPTLKIRRGAIYSKYKSMLDGWCEAPEKIIWEKA